MVSNNNPRKLEKSITEIAMRLDHSGLPEFEAILDDESKPVSERLRAYCVIFTFLRRRKDINRCFELYEKYQQMFKKEFLFLHLYSIALKQTGRKSDYKRSIEVAREAIKICPRRHAGALHNLAESLYLLADEIGLETTDARKLLDEAKDLIELVISIEPDYPKFHGTKAKIDAGLGDFPSAIREIASAIDREDSSSTDYPLRVSDYLETKMRIELRRSVHAAVKASKAEIQKAVEETRRSHIEILSFFVAAVSFIIGGINVAVALRFEDASRLIFYLASAILFAMVGFVSLYDSDRLARRILLAMLIGGIIFALGFFVPFSGR